MQANSTYANTLKYRNDMFNITIIDKCIHHCSNKDANNTDNQNHTYRLSHHSIHIKRIYNHYS